MKEGRMEEEIVESKEWERILNSVKFKRPWKSRSNPPMVTWLSTVTNKIILKFGDDDEPILVNKVDVSSTFHWKYNLVWVDPRQFERYINNQKR